MAIVTAWTDPIGGEGVAMSYTTIDAPNNTTARTGSIPFHLPAGHVTVFFESTATLSGNSTFSLEGSADGTTFVTLESNIIPTTDLASSAAGAINLEKWSAMKFRLAITTAGNDSTKDITFYLVYRREI